MQHPVFCGIPSQEENISGCYRPGRPHYRGYSIYSLPWEMEKLSGGNVIWKCTISWAGMDMECCSSCWQGILPPCFWYYCYQLHGEKSSIPGLGELGRRIPKETGYVIYRVNIQISIEAFAIPVSIRAIFQPEITEKDPEFRDFPTASTGFCQLCQADILRAGL